MGRGGGGGGSRGGGGRSGGSRGGSFRSSSSSGRSSFSRSSGRGSSFGGFHSSGPSRVSMSGGWHRPPPARRTYYRSSGGRPGCLSSILSTVIVIVIMFAVIGVMSNGGGGGNITRSTIEREKLDGQYLNYSAEWYDDSAMGWIRSDKMLKDGLLSFYDETGVQPYLVITDNIYGDTTPTGEAAWDYANEVYDQMFDDEGHMVFVFQCVDNGTDYTMAACTGMQAKTVVDDEALEILYDYIDSYFWSDRDEDLMFADAFRDAGKRMMDTQMPTGQVVAIVVGAVAMGLIVLVIVKNVNKRAKEKAAETQRILETPVEKFGDTSLDDLKDKYDGM